LALRLLVVVSPTLSPEGRGGAPHSLGVEQERRRVWHVVERLVRVGRATRRVDRVADRDLVADAEDRVFGSRGEPSECIGVARRGLVETLPAGEAIGPRELELPEAIVRECPALQLPDPNVVEIRVDLVPHLRVAAPEGQPRGLLRAREA
jgi:hypothetical protein